MAMLAIVGRLQDDIKAPWYDFVQRLLSLRRSVVIGNRWLKKCPQVVQL